MLLSEVQLDQLHENDGEKDARTGRRREDRGKVKADDEPGFTCLYKFFDCARSDCVEKPEKIGQVQGNLKQENSIETQRRVLKDGKKDAVLDVSTRKLVATEEDQDHLNFPEDSKGTRRLVASGRSEFEGKDKIWPHNLHLSVDGVPHMEKVFSIVRQRYGLSPRENMKDLDVHATTWGVFMSVTLQAADHLGTSYTENLRSTKNQPKKH